MCPPVNLAHAEEPVSTCSAKNLTSVWIMQFPDNDLTALRQQHVYLWLCEVCATFAALLLRLLGFKSPWNRQYLLIFLHFKLRNWNTTLLNVFVSAKSIEWPPKKIKEWILRVIISILCRGAPLLSNSSSIIHTVAPGDVFPHHELCLFWLSPTNTVLLPQILARATNVD